MNSNELDKISWALVRAIAEMPALEMDGRNPFYKSRYVTLGAVIAATRGILAKHGLAAIQQVISNPEGDAVGIRTMILHESGQYLEWEAVVKIPLDGNAGQEAGKLITYLRRYSLAAALNLYSDEDIDANTAKQQSVKRSQPQKVPPGALSTMTLEQAGKVKNRDGIPYTEIEPDRLVHMSRSIDKAIKANGHDPARLEQLQTKRNAIDVIMAERTNGGVDQP